MASIYEEARSQRHVRRIMVFMCDDNPLWADMALLEKQSRRRIATERLVRDTKAHSEKTPTKRFDLLGVSRTYFTKWQDGQLEDVSSAYRQIHALRDAVVQAGDASPQYHDRASSIVKAMQAFLDSASADAAVTASGKALGYRDDNAVRMALDRLFHRHHPLFKKPYLNSAETAAHELKRIDGLHQTWMRRGPDLFLQCSMDFRYAVELPEGHAIRVRLDVPLINAPRRSAHGVGSDRAPHTPYDGWVMLTQTSRMFLTFETRHADSRGDLISMIIDNWPDHDQWRGGSYLTANQDNGRRTVSDLVLLRSLSASETVELRVVRKGHAEFAELASQAMQFEGSAAG